MDTRENHLAKKLSEDMELSIIIVSWNAKDYLSKCLNSLYQEKSNIKKEIIVVDNGSTDGSPELVTNNYPDIKLICNKSNKGFAGANNIGIRQCNGKYVCLINSDIIVLKDCLTYMRDHMERHRDIGMLGPKILNPDRTLQPSCMGFPTLWNTFSRALALDTLFPRSRLFGGRLKAFWAHDKVCNVEVLNGCFWMIRREALNKVGLLDENYFIYGEDTDLCKRFHNAGFQIVFFPGAEAIHYGGASSSNAPMRFYIEMHRANSQYWQKHHGRLAWISYILITLLHQILRIVGQATIYALLPSKRKQIPFKIKRSFACIQWVMNIFLFHEDQEGISKINQ